MRKDSTTRIYILLVLSFIVFIAHSLITTNTNEAFSSSNDSLREIPFRIEPTEASISALLTPRILYHSWHSNKVPQKMAENIYALLKSNPEFEYYLYSDEKSAEYIRENYDEDVISAFETLKPGAFKSDLWRYCILYKTGGVYMDIKYNTVEPLISLIQKTSTIYVRDRDFFGELKCIYNGVMASPPGNEIFKHCIDDVVRNCKLKLYNSYAADVTGPCVLGRMMMKHEPTILKNIQYTYEIENVNGINYDIIKYNNTTVMRSYAEYRTEQRQFQQTERYEKMWTDKNVYH